MPRFRNAVVVLGLWLIVLAAYSNSFRAGFVLDNRGLILEDPRIEQLSGKNVALILQHTYWWPRGETRLYRPVTTLSYLFNYAILDGRDQPAGYHWVNFFLHLLNVALVFALALRFLKERWAAIFVAGVWAVHPLLTESVTNIIGRSDLLAGACVLGGFLIYLKSTEAKGWLRAGWMVGLGLATLIGVFSKESAVAIAGVVALYELMWWKDRREWRGLLLGCAAMAPGFLLLFYQRAVVLAGQVTTETQFLDNPIVGAGFVTARLTALKVMAKYVWRLLWPGHLSADYSYAAVALAKGSAGDWAAWITVAVLIGAAGWQLRRNKVVFFFAAFAFVNFLPVSNLIFPIGTIMAERFMYLPAIAFAVCVVLAAQYGGSRLGRREFAAVLCGLLILAFAVRTWRRNADWRDDRSLWTSVVESEPGSFKGHAGLANALFQSDSGRGNLREVIAEADKGIAILDPVADVRNSEVPYADAGLYYMTKGALAERLETTAAAAAGNGGSVVSRGAYERAQVLLKRAVAIEQAFYTEFRKKELALGKTDAEIPRPGFARLYSNLADNSLRLGDEEMAYEAANTARRMEPGDAKNYEVFGEILAKRGQREEAQVALAEGVIVSGGRATDLVRKLGELYSAVPDAKNCAIIRGARGETLNSRCEPVHNDLCKAAARLVEMYREKRVANVVDGLEQYRVGLSCAAE